MDTTPDPVLTHLFEHWQQEAAHTRAALGPKAHAFVELYNDLIDLWPRSGDAAHLDLESSAVALDLAALYRELPWLHAAFLAGNYPLVLTRLRHLWEMMFRALYADNFAADHPDDPDQPSATIDERVEWLERREKGLNWPRLMAPLLRMLIPDEGAEARFKPVWDRLHRAVHPSGALRLQKIEADQFVADHFDERWAREILSETSEVFGLIWLVVTARFPTIVPRLLANPNRFLACAWVRDSLVRS